MQNETEHSSELRPEMSKERASAKYEIVSIVAADRFNVVFKHGSKMRLACWVHLRHKETGETLVTGGVSLPGSGAQLTLAIDMEGIDRFIPM